MDWGGGVGRCGEEKRKKKNQFPHFLGFKCLRTVNNMYLDLYVVYVCGLPTIHTCVWYVSVYM